MVAGIHAKEAASEFIVRTKTARSKTIQAAREVLGIDIPNPRVPGAKTDMRASPLIFILGKTGARGERKQKHDA